MRRAAKHTSTVREGNTRWINHHSGLWCECTDKVIAYRHRHLCHPAVTGRYDWRASDGTAACSTCCCTVCWVPGEIWTSWPRVFVPRCRAERSAAVRPVVLEAWKSSDRLDSDPSLTPDLTSCTAFDPSCLRPDEIIHSKLELKDAEISFGRPTRTAQR